MPEALAKVLLAYALGNVMGGAVVGRLRGGVDLRVQGSGNVGATNALRTQGAGFGLAVLAIDVIKGVTAARVIPALPWGDAPDALSHEWLACLCGAAVALGHCYPLSLGFHGGKGVATLAGVFGALMPAALPPILLVFALVLMLGGYVSLATVCAAVTALLCAVVAGWDGGVSAMRLFALAMFCLVLFKHRDNLARLWRGEENRFEKARVLGRLLPRRAG